MRLTGFDVSHFQGEFDFAARAAKGDKFCFVKATQGLNYVDPQFYRNWQEAQKAGLLVGAYHFFDPSQDAAQQAQHFLSTVGDARIGDLPMVLDLEQMSGQRVSTVKAGALTFLRAVQVATGRAPIFYSYRSFIQGLGNMSDFASYPLWIALYSASVTRPNAIKPWLDFTFWQYSDGGSSGLDLNFFNGDLPALMALSKVV